jgi:hypothetical protein
VFGGCLRVGVELRLWGGGAGVIGNRSTFGSPIETLVSTVT